MPPNPHTRLTDSASMPSTRNRANRFVVKVSSRRMGTKAISAKNTTYTIHCAVVLW